ncbi:hypothetical protein Pan241w_53360 [Gimesia alba]|uniref:Uncharacterized protein n=1 Tax=Gimesia alba TaxID=2527973 RepID=A0A517RMV2_9PLAN|nr:hypothetical protein [Gimesia alba]QDT45217.1 hypothetical protein Pan241w_53360 [Gimesia alba]
MSQIRKSDEFFIYFSEIQLERSSAVISEVFELEFRLHKKGRDVFVTTLFDIHEKFVDLLSGIFLEEKVCHKLRTNLVQELTKLRNVIDEVLQKPLPQHNQKKWRYRDEYPDQFKNATNCLRSLHRISQQLLTAIREQQSIIDKGKLL